MKAKQFARIGPCMLAVSVVALACHSGDSRRSAIVTDSAGVQIVFNPSATGNVAWSVDPSPILQIGMVEGPTEYLFDAVAGAARLTDGSIAVADATAGSVRIYSETGRFLRSYGQPGAGPGEFISMRLHRIGGDTLLITDVTNRRFTVLDPNTGFVGAVAFPPGLSAVDVRGVIGGAAVGWRLEPQQGLPAAWDSSSIVLVDFRTGLLKELGRAAYRKREGREMTALLSSTEDGYWYGAGESFELARYDEAGQLLRLVRMPPAGSEESSAEGPERTAVTAVSDHPYIGSIVDTERNLWVWTVKSDGAPVWYVFADDGRYVAQVDMPDGFMPFEIGSDYVLSRHWDEFRVEYVRLYRLSTNGV